MEGFPSFKLTYRRRIEIDGGLSGFADSDWGNSSSRRTTCVFTQVITDSLEVEVAQDNSAINSRSRILLSVHCGYGGSVLLQPPREYGVCRTKAYSEYEYNTACIEWGNNVLSSREQAKHIDIRKHFAHEVIQHGHMKLASVSTTSRTPIKRGREN
jgi:hypothetical protein